VFWVFYKFCLKNSYLEKNSARYCNKFKVAGSIPDDVIGTFHWHNPSDRTMALGSNQPLAEMSTRNIFKGVKAAGSSDWQPYHLQKPSVLKFWEHHPPGAQRVCPGQHRDCFKLRFTVANVSRRSCKVPLCKVLLCKVPSCKVPLCKVPLCKVPSCKVPSCKMPVM